MKKILVSLFLLSSITFAFTLDDFYKLFSYSADTVFINSISAINSSPEYEIVEIQSTNGNILFKRGSKYYLLTVTKRYQNQTEVKILPQNSDFSQGSIVPSHLFGLIDSKLKNPLKEVK